MKTEKQRELWADKHGIGNVPVKDAWCNKCCDTAALLVLGKWHCGSCGSTRIELATEEAEGRAE